MTNLCQGMSGLTCYNAARANNSKAIPEQVPATRPAFAVVCTTQQRAARAGIFYRKERTKTASERVASLSQRLTDGHF